MNNLDPNFIEMLTKYISFKSISTNSEFTKETQDLVIWLLEYLGLSGAINVQAFQRGKTNPVVFGEFHVSADVPTLLVYGHYDVQPADVYDGWSSADPFRMVEKDGKLVGRGVVDNKGQNLIHLYTVARLYKSKNLKYNVKFLLEGNEESGNPDLPVLLREHMKLLSSDYVIVSDGEVVGTYPVMESTLRGGGNIRVVYTTGRNNLHSGIFGGAVPSAPLELSRVLAKLKDSKNRVSLKGFYDGVSFPSQKQQINNQQMGTSASAKKLAGVKTLLTLRDIDFYSQTGLLPTIEISGIKSGYIGDGFANIVPASAEARINIRTVPGQKTAHIMSLVRDYLVKSVPRYVEVEVYVDAHGDPIVLNTILPLGKIIEKLLTRVYSKKVLYKYVGGSIPILADFQNVLKTPVISIPLCNDDCNMHGVDENYSIELMKKGLLFSEVFFSGQVS